VSILTRPADIDSVVKSRLQAGHASALRYKSSLDGLLTILQEEGVEGLYKGIGSKLVQSVLTAAILFAGQRRIYELTKKVRIISTPVVLADLRHCCDRLSIPSCPSEGVLVKGT
jgi:Mitochondrial carrier protein